MRRPLASLLCGIAVLYLLFQLLVGPLSSHIGRWYGLLSGGMCQLTFSIHRFPCLSAHSFSYRYQRHQLSYLAFLQAPLLSSRSHAFLLELVPRASPYAFLYLIWLGFQLFEFGAKIVPL